MRVLTLAILVFLLRGLNAQEIFPGVIATYPSEGGPVTLRATGEQIELRGLEITARAGSIEGKAPEPFQFFLQKTKTKVLAGALQAVVVDKVGIETGISVTADAKLTAIVGIGPQPRVIEIRPAIDENTPNTSVAERIETHQRLMDKSISFTLPFAQYLAREGTLKTSTEQRENLLGAEFLDLGDMIAELGVGYDRYQTGEYYEQVSELDFHRHLPRLERLMREEDVRQKRRICAIFGEDFDDKHNTKKLNNIRGKHFHTLLTNPEAALRACDLNLKRSPNGIDALYPVTFDVFPEVAADLSPLDVAPEWWRFAAESYFQMAKQIADTLDVDVERRGGTFGDESMSMKLVLHPKGREFPPRFIPEFGQELGVRLSKEHGGGRNVLTGSGHFRVRKQVKQTYYIVTGCLLESEGERNLTLVIDAVTKKHMK